MSDDGIDPNASRRPGPRGLSTRAIRAASHMSKLDQTPTSIPQSSKAEQLAAGITPGLLRVSVGLEDLEDLQADFSDALAAALAVGDRSVPALGAV